MTKIFKLEITTTVLIETQTAQEASTQLDNMSLSEIADEMDSGDLVGNDIRGDVVEVPKNEIEGELLAVGNDGTFFAIDEDEDADAELEDSSED